MVSRETKRETARDPRNGRQRPDGTGGAWARAHAALLIALLAAFAWLAAERHYVRAYSDPYNWLQFALDFRNQLSESRWPYGFPLFLNLGMRVTGPYAIFLVNLPVFLVLFLLIWILGRALRDRTPSGLPAGWAGLAAVIPAMAADASNFPHYLNPYRDPLSYVLLFGCILVFLRAIRLRRAGLFAAAGLLLGAACSVREPSILLLGPLALFGLVEWRCARGALPFRRSVLAFGAGFGIALLPLLAQTYATTSQLALPPQAAIEGRVVPGMNFTWESFADTAKKAVGHYARMPWLPAGALAGLAAALLRRQRVIWFLLFPALVIYALFYSLYWTFFTRYFHIVTLLMCLFAGYALDTVLRAVLPVLRPGRRAQAGTLFLAGLCLLVGLRLHRALPRAPRFQVAQARAFSEAIAPHLPESAVVLAPRHMCELLSLFPRRASYPVPVWETAGSRDMEPVFRHVDALLDAGRPVFTMEIEYPDSAFGDAVILRRMFDVERVRSFHADEYRMWIFAPGAFHLSRVMPRTRQRTQARLPWPEGDAVWVALDAGRAIPPGETGTPEIRIRIPDGDASFRVARDGLHVLGIERGTDRAGELALDLRAEPPGRLPGEPVVQGGPLHRPIDLWFHFVHAFDTGPLWSGELLPASPGNRIPFVWGEAQVLVPTPLPDRGTPFLEWRIRSNRHQPGRTHRIRFYEEEEFLAEIEIPRDRRIRSARVELPVRPDLPERRLRLVRLRDPGDIPAESVPDGEVRVLPDAVEFHRLLLHRVGGSDRVEFRVGELDDTPYVRSGLHDREGGRDGAAPFRWTDGRAVFDLPLRPGGAGLRLEWRYSTPAVPETSLASDPRVLWNGVEIAAASIQPVRDPDTRLWTGFIDARHISRENRLEILSDAWRPSDQGHRDPRQLGVRLEWIRAAPDPDPPAGADLAH